MVDISLINPLDQPTGRRRLLGELKDGLQNDAFSQFRFIVAFAKAGPLLRMKLLIEQRRNEGLKIDAIFGLDQQGTTAQALTFALDHFSNVYVTREPNLTFHPKMYMFSGTTRARLFIGSNNLTVGGTETNFETAIRLDMKLPAEQAALKPFEDCWNELLPGACPATQVLTRALLANYVRDGTVPDEEVLQQNRAAASRKAGAPKPPRSGLLIKPPSTLPKKKPVTSKAAGAAKTAKAAVTPTAADPYSAQGLAMQIKPHHNGEIFLSVTAALQNPAFFKWPFTGATIPKKGSNTAYPQLTPDPLVNIVVYGKGAPPVLTLIAYALNTVYYEKKSEIRITASPLVGTCLRTHAFQQSANVGPGVERETRGRACAYSSFNPYACALPVAP